MIFQHHAGSRAFYQLVRITQTTSGSGIFKRFFERKRSKLGQLADRFQDQMGCPTHIPGCFASHDPGSPVTVHDFIPGLVTKHTVPYVVYRTYVADLLYTIFASIVEVCLDGEISRHFATATYDCFMPVFRVQALGIVVC